MLKAILLGLVGLIAGMFLISEVILPVASTLLGRPDIDSWMGLGALLRLLGLLLLGALYAGFLLRVYRSKDSSDG